MHPQIHTSNGFRCAIVEQLQLKYTETHTSILIFVCLIEEKATKLPGLHNISVISMYRIAGIFQGYKCSRFSRIEPVPRKFIPTKIYK